MSPGDKLFPPPGSFNFSMAHALAADPQALASELNYMLSYFFYGNLLGWDDDSMHSSFFTAVHRNNMQLQKC